MERLTVHPEHIQEAIDAAIQHLTKEIEVKGDGTFVTTHELFGVLAEEYHEFIDAVRENDISKMYEELKDISTVVLFGMACMKAKTIE